MNTLLYRFISHAFQEWLWGGDLLDADNLPASGPAIFIANHLGALGPIAVGASIPAEMHFWIHASLLDPQLAPSYLHRDFIEPELHIPPPFGPWLASAISKIHIPLLRAVGGIPVYHTSEGFQRTFCQTIDLLTQGHIILIFPEDPGSPLDPRYNMRPFYKGFARLGELFYDRTRTALRFYPLAVHAPSRTVRVGKPIRYNPFTKPTVERRRLKSVLEQSIQQMLLQASSDGFLRVPLPN